MSYYDFNKVMTLPEWYVFKDAVLSNIEVDDCETTLTGQCVHTKNLEDCLSVCEKTPQCTMGYYIETGGRNFCAPLKHRNTIPYYRLHSPDIYPELKGSTAWFFTDKKILPFPPKYPNAIFYKDSFASNKLLSGNSIQFLPARLIKAGEQEYIPVKHGDQVLISIPKTSSVLTVGENLELNWSQGIIESVDTPQTTFRVFSADKTKKEGDMLSFSDSVYFLHQNMPVVFQDNNLFVHGEGYENAVYDNLSFIFELTPKIEVYYCEKGVCKKTSLELCQREGYNATYNGAEVQRSPNCWGMCKKKRWSWLVVVIVLILLCFLAYS